MKKAIVLTGVLLLAGCAANLQTATAPFTVNGQQREAVFLEGRGVHGATLATINVYKPDGSLESNNTYGSPGVPYSFFHGGLAGAEMGAGIGAGLAAQGAANVVQNSVGGGATQSQGQGIKSSIASTNVNSNVNTNRNFNAQAQGQLQGQAQGQLQTQGQGQSTGPFSPNTVF